MSRAIVATALVASLAHEADAAGCTISATPLECASPLQQQQAALTITATDGSSLAKANINWSSSSTAGQFGKGPSNTQAIYSVDYSKTPYCDGNVNFSATVEGTGITCTTSTKFQGGQAVLEFAGGSPQPISAECGDVPDAAIPLNVDGSCKNTADFTSRNVFTRYIDDNGTVTGDRCDFNIERKWIAQDPCGERTSHIQIVSVTDTTPPTLHTVEDDQTVECGYVPADCVVTCQDDCNACSVDHTITTTGGESDTCVNDIIAVHVHKWVTSDVCGNTFTDYQTVTVVDTQAPTLNQYPADENLDCENITPVPVVTASDNCEGGTFADVAGHNPLTQGHMYPVSVDLVTERTGNSAHTYTEVRTWTAVDRCGNSASHSQTVNVSDTTPPVLSGVEADQTFECDDVPPPCVVVATDNCDGDITYDLTSKRLNENCENSYQIVYTWTATDSSGNTASDSQTVTVVDNDAPTISGVPASGEEYDCLSEPTAHPTATDNCGAVTLTEDKTETVPCEGSGSYSIVYTAVDACGNKAQQTWTYTLVDNEGPVFQSTPQKEITVECTHTVDVVTPTAIDLCSSNTQLSYAVTGGKAALTECGNAQEVRTWTASDDCGNESEFSQTINYQDTTDPEFDASYGPFTVECDEDHTYPSVTATDNCDNDVAITSNAPGTSVSHSCTKDGFVVTYTASDNCGNTDTTAVEFHYEDTTPPECTVTPITGSDCSGGTDIDSLVVSCDDNCDDSVIADVSAKARCGKAGCACDYQVEYTYEAADDCGNPQSGSYTGPHWQDLTAPALDVQIPVHIDNNEECSGTNLSVDEIFAALGSRTCTDGNPCGGCTVQEDDSSTDQGCTILHKRTYTPVDDCGISGVSETYSYVEYKTYTPFDFVHFPADGTEQCGDPTDSSQIIALAHTAAGPAGSSLSYSAPVTTQDPNNASDEEDANGCSFSHSVTVTLSNDCGCEAQSTVTITYADTTPPSITAPGDETVDCDSGEYAGDAADATASDNCADANEISVVASATDKNNVVTYTATDLCGNTATDTQQITYEDTTPPVITAPSCSAVCALPTCNPATVTDDCDDAVELSSIVATPGGPCEHDYCVSTTYSATDSSGNTADDVTSTACYTQDTTVSTWTTVDLPGDETVEYCEIPDAPTLTAEGACGQQLTVVHSRTEQGNTVTDTWSTGSDCTQALTHSRTITLISTFSVTCNDLKQDIPCEDGASEPGAVNPAFHAPCGASVSVSEATTPGCGNSYQLTRTFSVTTDRGQSQTCVDTFAIVDSSPPEYANGAWTDNCGSVSETCTTDRDDHCTDSYTDTTTCTGTDECGYTDTYTYTKHVPYPTLTLTDAPDVPYDCEENINNVDVPEPESNRGKVTSQTSHGSNCAGAVAYIVYTASDDCGQSLTDTQTVYAVDTTPPTITPGADTTYDCLSNPSLNGPSADDNCDANPSIQETSSSATQHCHKAVDDCGNESAEVCSSANYVSHPEDPVFHNVPNTTDDCFQPPVDFDGWVAGVYATHYCGVSVTLNTGRTGDDCDSSYSWTWTAVADSDNINLVTETYSACLKDTHRPTLSPKPADYTVCDQNPDPPSGTVSVWSNGANIGDADFSQMRQQAGDDDDCLYYVVRTWSGSNDCYDVEHTQSICVETNCTTCLVLADTVADCDDIPDSSKETAALQDAHPGWKVTENKQTYIAGDCSQEYKIVRTWTITSEVGTTEVCPQTVSVVDNEAPVVTASATDAECPEEPTLDVSATDNCADFNGQGNDSGPGTVQTEVSTTTDPTYTPQCTKYTHTITATDECGNLSSEKTVSNSLCDTTPPTITAPDDSTNTVCDHDIVAGIASVHDTCCEPTVVATIAPFTDCNGRIPGAVITYTATDCHGNAASDTETITPLDITPPTLTSVDDQTVECPETFSFTPPTATDCDSKQSAQVSAPTITPVGTPNTDGYQEIYTWTATDDCGNTATTSATGTMRDTTTCDLSGVPLDQTFSCAQDHPIPTVTAYDACDANPDVNFSESKSEKCDDSYVIIRSWQCKDASGWTSQVESQTITVNDTTPPTVVYAPDSYDSEGCTFPGHGTPAFSDNCDYTVSSVDTTTCNSSTRTWTAADRCGLTATTSQTVTWKPASGARLVGVPADSDVECNGNGHGDAPTVIALDDCGNQYDVEFSSTASGDDCIDTLVRNWEAVIPCYGTLSDSQTSIIRDTVPPVLSDIRQSDTEECAAFAVFPHDWYAEANDDCDGYLGQVHGSYEPQDGIVLTCLDAYTVTFSAADDCGNTVTATRTRTIEDTTPPYAEWDSSSQTVDCEDDFPAAPQFTNVNDHCWPDDQLTPSITPVSTRSDEDEACYTVTYSGCISDPCGNKLTLPDVTVTVEDNEDPVIPSHSDVTRECDDAAYAPPATSGATDNCDNDLAEHLSMQVTQKDDGCSWARLYTWSVWDDCGNDATESWTVSSSDSTDPYNVQVSAPPSAECTIPTVTATADDACTDATATVTPPSAPASWCDASLVYTIDVADECGNGFTTSHTIPADDTTPPTINFLVVHPETVECGEDPSAATVTASDTCSASASLSVVVTGDSDAEGTIVYDYTAEDDCGNQATASRTVVVDDTTPPVCTFPTGGELECSDDFDFDVKCSDTCGGYNVEFSDVKTDNCIGDYTIVRTYSVTDDADNSISGSATFVSQDSGNPYWLTSGSDQTYECDNVTNPPAPVANDDCSTATVSAETTNGGDGCSSTTTITWTAADDCGNTAPELVQKVTGEDTTPPVFTSAMAGTRTVEYPCNDCEASTTHTATDNCNGATVTSSSEFTGDTCDGKIVHTYCATDACGNEVCETETIIIEDTTPSTIDIDGSDETVEFDEIPSAPLASCTDHNACTVTYLGATTIDQASACVYKVVHEYRSVDACGNQSPIDSVTVTVTDDDELAWSEFPDDSTWECDGSEPADCIASVADTCDGELTVHVSKDSLAVSGQTTSQTVYTFSATDSAGHTITDSATVTVQDTTPPTLSHLPEDATLECDCDTQPATVSAVDNCDVSVSVSVTDLGNGVTEWTATDSVGNSVSHQRTITIVDTTSPSLAYEPAAATIGCDQTPNLSNFARDNCDEDVKLSTDSSTVGDDCASVTTITWSATDVSGNGVTHTQEVTKRDDEPPRDYDTSTSLCMLPGESNQGLTIAASDLFDVHDSCGAVTFQHVACNSTATTGACSFNSGNYVFTTAEEGDGATWTVYGVASDACANTLELKKDIVRPASFAAAPNGCLPVADL